MDDLKLNLTGLEQTKFGSLKDRDKLAKLYKMGSINVDGEIKNE